MYQIIITVVSIVLMISASATVMNYTAMDSLMTYRSMQQAEKGFDQLEHAVIRYLDANRNVEGDILYPGDGVDLGTAISPEFGFLPAAVQGKFNWSVKSDLYQGLPAVGLCLSPLRALTAQEQDVLPLVRAKLPVGATVQAESCNAQVDSVDGQHLTLWIVLTHLH